MQTKVEIHAEIAILQRKYEAIKSEVIELTYLVDEKIKKMTEYENTYAELIQKLME